MSSKAHPLDRIADDRAELVGAAVGLLRAPGEHHLAEVVAAVGLAAVTADVAAIAVPHPELRIAERLADLEGVELASVVAVLRQPGGVAVGGADDIGGSRLRVVAGVARLG